MSMKRIAVRFALTTAFCFSGLFAQEKPAVTSTQEFPVTMRENVVAGKTEVGTKIEANLKMATLVAGKVVPEGAIFSGVVVDSSAKSPTSPSRLGIRMDSVQWKNDSLTLKTYLTQWYYPVQLSLGRDRLDDQQDGTGDEHSKRTWAAYNPNASDEVLFPGGSDPARPRTSPPPAMAVSDRRVTMKNVDLEKDADGGLVLTSSHSNLKLDKSTTYVLATGDLTKGK